MSGKPPAAPSDGLPTEADADWSDPAWDEAGEPLPGVPVDTPVPARPRLIDDPRQIPLL
jgi:hypothetical protein